MSPFSETTLCAGVFGRDTGMLLQTTRVLNYCASLFQFKRVLLFSHEIPSHIYRHEWIQTPDIKPQENREFVLPMVYRITGGPVMFVHWDGFILNPEMFDEAFLQYDTIGAVWKWRGLDMLENSFCWQSRKFVEAALSLPGQNPDIPQPTDVWLFGLMRWNLKSRGITLPPPELCDKFSIQFNPKGRQSFGFHGRDDHPSAFVAAWKKLYRWEQENFIRLPQTISSYELPVPRNHTHRRGLQPQLKIPHRHLQGAGVLRRPVPVQAGRSVFA